MLHLLAVLVLAGHGGPSLGLGPASARAAGLPGASDAPFTAVFSATTHRPRAATLWHYAIRVSDPAGKPIQARVRFLVAFAGPSGPPPRQLGGAHTVHGGFRATFRWPRATRGQPLVFQAIVTARGTTRRLAYWIRVR